MEAIFLTDGIRQIHNPSNGNQIWKDPSKRSKWYGDPSVPESISVHYGPEAFLNRPFMSTGIITQYTDQGFAIAADSLRKDLTTGEVISQKVQKIFKIEESENRRVLAYAVSGAPECVNENGEVVLSLAEEFKKAVSELRTKPIGNMASYVQHVGELVNAQLSRVKEDRLVSTYPDLGKGLIAKVLFVGYYHDVGMLAQMEFGHVNQTLSPPNITRLLIGPPAAEIFSGSTFITNKIWHEKDRRFAKYRTPSVRASLGKNRLIPPETLDEAKTMVVNYLQACIDNRGLDPAKECDGIGGQIHAATVTPDGRCQWYRKPDFIHESDQG